MNEVFVLEGKVENNGFIFGSLLLKDVPMYINLPEWIDERNIYTIDTKEQFATLKPKKFSGLTYRILDYDDVYAVIKTIDYGECLVKITEVTTITNYPMYERGGY